MNGNRTSSEDLKNHRSSEGIKNNQSICNSTGSTGSARFSLVIQLPLILLATWKYPLGRCSSIYSVFPRTVEKDTVIFAKCTCPGKFSNLISSGSSKATERNIYSALSSHFSFAASHPSVPIRARLKIFNKSNV